MKSLKSEFLLALIFLLVGWENASGYTITFQSLSQRIQLFEMDVPSKYYAEGANYAEYEGYSYDGHWGRSGASTNSETSKIYNENQIVSNAFFEHEYWHDWEEASSIDVKTMYLFNSVYLLNINSDFNDNTPVFINSKGHPWVLEGGLTIFDNFNNIISESDFGILNFSGYFIPGMDYFLHFNFQQEACVFDYYRF